MQFEWDQTKAERSIKKHRVSFDEALTVFYDPFSATFNDADHSIGEHRYITVGYFSRRRSLVVAHVERKEAAIRIISARLATAQERKRHES